MERYEKLEMEIIEFETEDVITASGEGKKGTTRALDFLDLFYDNEGQNGNGGGQ